MSTPSKTFLFTTWEGGGNIPPVITLARRLRERGHRVRLMSDEASREDAEAAGIAFHPWRNAPNRPDKTPESCPLRDWESASPQEGIGRVLSKIMFGPALEYAQDLAAALDEEPADLVLTSDMLPGPLAACESRGQRVAILSANLCLYPLPGMPAFGPGLPPPRTAEEAALHEQIRAGTLQMLDAHVDGLNRARVALGLKPVASVLDQLAAASRYLLASSRCFDFPIELVPEPIRYIGPLLDEPAWAQPWRSPWPADDARPLIAVGFSTTYQAHEGVLQKVIDAAAELPVRVLVTLGRIDPASLRPAANTAMVPSAPHNAVMEHARLVVTHGGHGTVLRALRHHRPLLVIPHGRDQDENAARVVEHGVGLRLTAACSTVEIREALNRLLNVACFAENARRLGTAISQESQNMDPVAEVEALACAAGVH
ncbi:MAG: glycosyltransferase family 1 protein [Verrucomicrobiaceae bacterium]|nr:glycosyltransferase family 1 protein [Verrucomicrobiaceae bacterium]